MRKRLFSLATVTLALGNGVIRSEVAAAKLAPCASRFEVNRDKRTLAVWCYLPENAKADAPVLIVMQGVNRDGGGVNVLLAKK